jgi:hypothetical protein
MESGEAAGGCTSVGDLRVVLESSISCEKIQSVGVKRCARVGEDDRREERGRGSLAMVRIDRRYLQMCGPPARDLSSLAARFEERWGGE